MNRFPDLDALRTFVAIADTCSFTTAAARVGRTQSTISQQGRRMEAQIGQPLFERTTRQVALTRTGLRLLDDARALLRLAEQAAGRLAAQEIDGEVRLGVPEEYACHHLPEKLAHIRAVVPGVVLHVEVGISGDLEAALADGRLDIAVIKRLGAVGEPLVWVGRPEAAAVRPLPLGFFREPCQFRSASLATLARQNVDAQIVLTATSHAALKAAADAGGLVTVLTDGDRGNIPLIEALPQLPAMRYEIRSDNQSDATAFVADCLSSGAPQSFAA